MPAVAVASDVRSRVIAILDDAGVDVEDATDSSAFIADLGMDSLGVVEFVMALEEEFKIAIPDEEAEKILTLGECVRHIEAKLAAR